MLDRSLLPSALVNAAAHEGQSIAAALLNLVMAVALAGVAVMIYSG